jgi:hypothetical protein
VHVPTPLNVTTPEETEQVVAVADVTTTTSPEIAVAEGEYVAPYTGGWGDVEFTVMEFAPPPTEKLWYASAATYVELPGSWNCREHVPTPTNDT